MLVNTLECGEIISKAWDTQKGEIDLNVVMDKIRNYSCKLEVWKKISFQLVKKNIQQARN